MPISLLIADDHDVVRMGLKKILESTDINVEAEAVSGDEVLGHLRKSNFDVILLDVRMASGDGLHTLGRVLIDRPEQAILFFSTYNNPTYVARAVALNAKGYVLKSDPPQRLVEAIRLVANGEDAWTRDELRRVTGALAMPRSMTDVDVPLTQREGEVLKLMTNGLTNKEIASQLCISYETVKEHVQHILRKVGVSDRTQAAVWAVRSGLL